ncbi:MAG: hypothetical protein DHS20C15_12090 [Planctomycetota bacterium]|nr:MAG: hypothetical protein DHS20C15_12090 [Planctomycetota bacterium]
MIVGLLGVGLIAVLAILWLLEDRGHEAPRATLPGAAQASGSSLPQGSANTEREQPRALEKAAVVTPEPEPEWPDGVVRIELSGRVVDEFGAPWPGAEVLFVADHLTLKAMPELDAGVPGNPVAHYPRTLTDAQGRFVLHGPRQSRRGRAGTRGQLDPVIAITAEGMAWQGHAARGFTGESMDLGDLALVHPGASFELRTVDEDGEPVAGVVVGMASAGGQSFADDDPQPPTQLVHRDYGITDENGSLLVEHLWWTRLTLHLEKPGYVAPMPSVNLDTGGHVDLGELVLTGGRNFSGLVVDAAGQPVDRAGVVIVASVMLDLVRNDGTEGIDAATTLFEPFQTKAPFTHTGADGRFELQGVVAGISHEAALLASAPGYRVSALEGVFLDQGERTIVLQRAGALDVELRNAATDASIDNATLRALQHTGFPDVRPAERGYNSAVRPYAELTVEGTRVFDAGPLDVSLFAAAPGFLAQRVLPPRLDPGEQRSLTIRLVPDDGLRGRALDERGEPVVDALIELNAAAPFGRLWGAQEVRTDARGEFVLPALLPGTWSGKASKPGHAEAEIAAFDSTQSRAAWELRLPRGARVHGLLRDAAGEPTIARWLKATREPGTPHALTEWARADRHGRYEFPGLQPGDWLLESAPGIEHWISVKAGDELELDLQFAPTLLLVGTTRRGSNVLSQVKVEAERNDLEDGEHARSVSTRSRGDGNYVLEVVEAGNYGVYFRTLDGTRLSREVLLQPGAPTRLDVDFGLGAIAGRAVLTTPGATLPDNARVGLRRGEAQERVDSSGFDEHGRFRFEPLIAGSYTLEVNTELLQAFTLGPIELAYGEQREDLELKLELGAALNGRVFESGSPGFQGFVHLRRIDGPELYRVDSVSSRSGYYNFRSLPPGDYQLDITTFAEPELGHGEGQRGEPGAGLPFFARETITLNAGEKHRLEIEVPRDAGN